MPKDDMKDEETYVKRDKRKSSTEVDPEVEARAGVDGHEDGTVTTAEDEPILTMDEEEDAGKMITMDMDRECPLMAMVGPNMGDSPTPCSECRLEIEVNSGSGEAESNCVFTYLMVGMNVAINVAGNILGETNVGNQMRAAMIQGMGGNVRMVDPRGGPGIPH